MKLKKTVATLIYMLRKRARGWEKRREIKEVRAGRK